MSREGMPEKEPAMVEVSKEFVEKIRTLLIKDLTKFSEGSIHPNVKEDTLGLIADIEAKRPASFGGRIFPEYLDGAIQDSGVKLYSPEYRAIRQQLESPETTG